MKKRECDCEKCRECCTREPGWFLPEEIPETARYLGLSEAIFIETYCQKHPLENAIALSPKHHPHSTACIFFEGGKCRIHPVKPFECAKVFACEPERRHRRTRALVARKWQ